MVPKLKVVYKEKVRSKLLQKLNLSNIHQVPKLIKIQINRGLGLAAQNNNILNKTINEFRLISGQQPIITKARNSVAGFKIRDGMSLGVTVTLRGDKMFTFLDRFINLALPRSRDFQGLSLDGFDNCGNYSIGLKEQLLFPEISYDSVDQMRGFNITFVTTAKTKSESFALLRELGLPIREKN